MSELPRRTPSDAIRRAQLDGSSEESSAGICVYCHRWADPAVIVATVHANSGAGWATHAHNCAAERIAL